MIHLGGWKQRNGRVISKWKPIVVYSKGEWTKEGEWFDVSMVKAKEKVWHPWQPSKRWRGWSKTSASPENWSSIRAGWVHDCGGLHASWSPMHRL